jgi:hypothetical protein
MIVVMCGSGALKQMMASRKCFALSKEQTKPDGEAGVSPLQVCSHAFHARVCQTPTVQARSSFIQAPSFHLKLV